MRKIIQIEVFQNPRVIVALCDDGTVWQWGDDARWFQCDPIPQPDDK